MEMGRKRVRVRQKEKGELDRQEGIQIVSGHKKKVLKVEG